MKELSSNRGGGDGGVVFNAPPPLNNDPTSSRSPTNDEGMEVDESPAVPSSPLHTDLEYLHKNLQKVSSTCHGTLIQLPNLMPT